MSDAPSGEAQPRHGQEFALFFGLTFLLIWILWGVLYLSDQNDLGGMIGPLGAFAPTVAALVALVVTGQGLRRSNSTGGSVLAVMGLHALINLIGGSIPMGVLPAAELATLVGVWVVAGAVIAIYGPATLSRRHPAATPAGLNPASDTPKVPA